MPTHIMRIKHKRLKDAGIVPCSPPLPHLQYGNVSTIGVVFIIPQYNVWQKIEKNCAESPTG